MTTKLQVAVLASGHGSNLQALIDAAQGQDYPAQLAVVVSNVASSKALERARLAHIPTVLLEHSRFDNKEAFEQALVETLQHHQVNCVCLAGFMRLLGPTFLKTYGGKTLNIHPSLLPAFPGLHGPRQALHHGVKFAGCTVHLVDEGTDTGPILGQAVVPVLDSDDENALAARILTEEHKLYPTVLKLWAQGKFQIRGRRSHGDGCEVNSPHALQNPKGS